MPVTRNEKIGGGIAAAAIVAIGAVGLIVADDSTTDAPTVSEQAAASGAAFEVQFATAGDFYDNFDYGYSGANPWAWGNGSGNGAIINFHGDHDNACQGPQTDRTVSFTGRNDVVNGSTVDLGFEQLFWHCAPNGPETGHMMTGVDTVHYNYAWFSPKPTFTAVSRVCWDVNATQMSSRKWIQIMFVGDADAVRYPSGSRGANVQGEARGTGGFDLGYTDPDHRTNPGPTTDIHPAGGTLAGFEYHHNGAVRYFQNQTEWTSGAQGTFTAGGDKASRYKNCIENQPSNQIRYTQSLNGAVIRTINLPGQIPRHSVRVVLQDNNYNPPKGDNYSSTVLTWHWDNVQIFTGTAPPVTTVPPTQPPTLEPPTTVTTTSTTVPVTTTSSTSTTTTVPGSSTVPPSDVVEVPRADLEALLASLEQLIATIQALLDG